MEPLIRDAVEILAEMQQASTSSQLRETERVLKRLLLTVADDNTARDGSTQANIALVETKEAGLQAGDTIGEREAMLRGLQKLGATEQQAREQTEGETRRLKQGLHRHQDAATAAFAPLRQVNQKLAEAADLAWGSILEPRSSTEAASAPPGWRLAADSTEPSAFAVHLPRDALESGQHPPPPATQAAGDRQVDLGTVYGLPPSFQILMAELAETEAADQFSGAVMMQEDAAATATTTAALTAELEHGRLSQHEQGPEPQDDEGADSQMDHYLVAAAVSSAFST